MQLLPYFFWNVSGFCLSSKVMFWIPSCIIKTFSEGITIWKLKLNRRKSKANHSWHHHIRKNKLILLLPCVICQKFAWALVQSCKKLWIDLLSGHVLPHEYDSSVHQWTCKLYHLTIIWALHTFITFLTSKALHDLMKKTYNLLFFHNSSQNVKSLAHTTSSTM